MYRVNVEKICRDNPVAKELREFYESGGENIFKYMLETDHIDQFTKELIPEHSDLILSCSCVSQYFEDSSIVDEESFEDHLDQVYNQITMVSLMRSNWIIMGDEDVSLSGNCKVLRKPSSPTISDF